jgi:hypothetical protein
MEGVKGKESRTKSLFLVQTPRQMMVPQAERESPRGRLCGRRRRDINLALTMLSLKSL